MLAWVAFVAVGVASLAAGAAGAAVPRDASQADPVRSELGAQTGAPAEPVGQAPAGPVAGAAGHDEQAGAEHGEGEAHEAESIWRTLARLLNFAILVGGLGYLLKTPLANYLEHRSTQISRDLVEAEQLRASAGEQIAQIDRRLQALPDEIEALKARGAAEVTAEEARIRAVADAERARLVEQTRREIDQQVRVARQELMREAADLAVGAAAERIRRQLTPEGQLRLVDRYADQVRDVQGRT